MTIYKRIKNKLRISYLQLKGFPKIVEPNLKGNLKMIHFSAFSYGNAGDIILPIVLRDLFNNKISIKSWTGVHVKESVNKKVLKVINKSNALIIGGGGLFLKDSHPNDVSGWQWNCSIDHLSKIESPIIMFAVGYNRFRGQEEFNPIFKQHLNKFIEKAEFIGIRNYGSIRKIKPYLNESLKEKLTFQPCMTTVISKLYPNLVNYDHKEDFIAFNCAFDREKLRLTCDSSLNAIARVAKKLSQFTKIMYFSHMPTDEKILPYFDKYGVNYTIVSFDNPINMISYYAKARLVIGMRGHSQMIPFGCKSSILSLISHDKLQFFLDDIGKSHWGVELQDDDLEKKLYDKAVDLYNNFEENNHHIKEIQDNFWDISQKNLKYIKETI
tara:strand:+ start:443 stop:1591 length:1149 start_codon:yes stop_codon:yes gene_type:complete